MGFHCVGVRKNKGVLAEYIILDEDTGEFRTMYDNECKAGLKRYRIANLGLVDGEIEFTNGTMERFTSFDTKKKPVHALVILRKFKNGEKTIGYRVYDGMSGTNGILQLMESELIEYSRKMKIANGKVIEKNGKVHISAINGEFETEDIKSVAPKMDQKLSLQEFMNMFIRKGCRVKLENETLEIRGNMKELVFENMNIPVVRTKMIVLANIDIKIKNLTIEENNIHLKFGDGSYVENLRLTAELGMNNVYLENIDVKRCVTFGKLSQLFNITVLNGLREFIGGRQLVTMTGCFDGDSIELIDLRNCEDGRKVERCFTEKGNNKGRVVKVWPGKFEFFTGFLGNSSVQLMEPFDPSIRLIDGFDRLVGVKKLDFRENKELFSIGGMRNGEFTEVYLPEYKGLEIADEFACNVPLEEVSIPKVTGRVTTLYAGVFASTKMICLDATTKVMLGRKNEGQTYRVIPYNKVGRVPVFTTANQINLEFEEGTEVIVEGCKDRVQIKELTLPKSLKIIGKNAFSNKTIYKSNMSETSVVEIKEKAFDGSSFREGIAVCPETLKILGDKAFNSDWIKALYVPKSVEAVGKFFFNGDILYLTKGCYVDKKKKGAYAKVYVNSFEDVKAILGKHKSSEREKAKVVMAVGGKEGYEWIKEPKYKEHARFLLEVDRALKDTTPVERGVILDETKYVEFPLRGLGELGSAIEQRVKAHRGLDSGGKITDRFKVLSNLITNNIPFYAGHFTKKALEIFGKTAQEIENYIQMRSYEVLYADERTAIILVQVDPVESSLAESEMRAVVIIIDDKIKYTTLISQKDVLLNDLVKYTGRGNRVEDYIVVGDGLAPNKTTLTNKVLPLSIEKSYFEWVNGSMVKIGEEGKNRKVWLSLQNGNMLIIYGDTVAEIIKPEKHKYNIEKWVKFNYEGSFRYFDILNGIVKLEKRVMEDNKAEMVRIAEKIRGLGEELKGNKLVEFILGELKPMELKVPIKTLKHNSYTNLGDYNIVAIHTKSVIEKVGYHRGDNKLYVVAKYDESWGRMLNNTKVKGYVVNYNLERWVGKLYNLKVDGSVPEPKLFEKYKKRRTEEFIYINQFSGSLSVGVSKSNGKAYLLFQEYIGTPTQMREQVYTVLGQLRDEVEAMEVLCNDFDYGEFAEHYNVDSRGFELADKARRGEIPVGAHPEYTINASKIYEVLGL